MLFSLNLQISGPFSFIRSYVSPHRAPMAFYGFCFNHSFVEPFASFSAKRCSSDSRLGEGDARRSEQVRAFARIVAVFSKKPLSGSERYESSLSGTRTLCENEGRRPQPLLECFFCFFLQIICVISVICETI